MKPSNFALVFLVLTTVWMPIASGQNIQRPNIILMMADDMGMGDTSAYQDFTGNSDSDQLHTPAMERLARMGVRFTDAHTPSSRCSPTRYGLLTGRYPWRNRLKFWVLFGAQGDPMIERDRPTIATLLQAHDYRTAMVGKWHVGLRYRQSDGRPAAEFADADLTKPLFDTPLDHGFDYCEFTSRSHGTSGPQPGNKNKPNQMIGPGHVDGRVAIGATGNGRQLTSEGDTAYVLDELGGRHSDNAMAFLQSHVNSDDTKSSPFFLYYPSNSNHAPHTPDTHVGDAAVQGAARNVAGQPTDNRNDYIYENDVALGRLMDWLAATPDPRNDGKPLSDNTLVIFTSDNGAEKNSNIATGPFRSHKGSCYEGGHRVPFIASWPAGGVGDGNDKTPGRTSVQLLGLTDIYATFADILGSILPNNSLGQKGAEDSVSMLHALTGDQVLHRPIFTNDHKEAKADNAVATFRLDDPANGDLEFPGQWKIFFDHQLLRSGIVNPVELYDLSTDPTEANNRISETELQLLVDLLSETARHHRTAGGHRLAESAADTRIRLNWLPKSETAQSRDKGLTVLNVSRQFASVETARQVITTDHFNATVTGVNAKGESDDVSFAVNPRGLGLIGSGPQQVNAGEALLVSFDRDVIVESAAIVAGNGTCGGYYQVGDAGKLAIYCVDADIDSKDQSGILSDIGVVKAGQILRLDSSPHYGVETPGQWRLGSLTIRLLK